MKQLDEMTVTELKAQRHDYMEQRDQALKAMEVIGNLIQLRMKEEHQKAQVKPPDREEAAAN